MINVQTIYSGVNPIKKFQRKILLYAGIDQSDQSRDLFRLCDLSIAA